MKSIRNLFFILTLFAIASNSLLAQKAYGNFYHPEANATEDIAQAVIWGLRKIG